MSSLNEAFDNLCSRFFNVADDMEHAASLCRPIDADFENDSIHDICDAGNAVISSALGEIGLDYDVDAAGVSNDDYIGSDFSDNPEVEVENINDLISRYRAGFMDVYDNATAGLNLLESYDPQDLTFAFLRKLVDDFEDYLPGWLAARYMPSFRAALGD